MSAVSSEVMEIDTMMNHLQLVEKSAVSVEKLEEDYVLDIALQSSKHGEDRLLAATSSSHSIRLYKHVNLANIGSIKGHDDKITGISFGNEETNLVFSSSTDKTIRCWDVRTDNKKPVQTFEGYDETNNLFTSFDVNSNDRVICAGTEADENEVHLLFWDRRQASLMGSYSESHCDDITQVKFHPSKFDLLLTGSTDGLVCKFDVSEPSEDDAIQLSLNPDSAVARIGWCGAESENIYCITHTDTFHLWEGEEGDLLKEICDIKDKLKDADSIDYLVDCVSSQNKYHLLAGKHSGEVKLIDVSGEDCKVILSLTGGHSATVRCQLWDPQTSTLVTGGEDSFLCLWSASSKPVTDHKKVKLKMKKTVTKKSKPY